MAVTNTWTNPTALDRNTGQTIREQDWDGVLSDLMVLGGTNGSSGVNKYNLLTNGGFEIWQRGNGPFTGSGTWTADRWSVSLSGTDTISVSRDTTNIDSGSISSAAVVFTKGTGTNSGLSQPIENPTAFRSRIVTLSIRVRTTVANAVRPYVTIVTGTRTYGAYHSGGGSWEILTVTATIDPSSTLFGPGVEFNTSCTAYLDNAMLVVGSVPADYAPLHPADDLARCLRYYEHVSYGASSGFGISGIATAASQAIRANMIYKAIKPVTPTVTKVGTWPVNNCGQPLLSYIDVSAATVYVQSSAAGDTFSYANTGSDLTIEANP